MERRSRRPQFASRPESSSANVTSAVGMEEPVGRLRARRSSLFTQTVMWITGLICLAFLVGSLVQAWSNSQLMQQLQSEQQKLQQAQTQNTQLTQAAGHYKDPTVVASEARQQLGYVRPGEQPVVIVSSNTSGTQNTATVTHGMQQQNFWQDWWRMFFAK